MARHAWWPAAIALLALCVASARASRHQAQGIPLSLPFDNPLTDSNAIPAIPSAPDCTVRPQTVIEIQTMREAAARIATSIQTEIGIMAKRKAYVEQMTSYLNDRILELNKVKSELAQESRWIELSNNLIEELAQKEKLIKMQDILACLNTDAQRLTGQSAVESGAMKTLQGSAKVLTDKITAIKKAIENINAGKPADGTPAPQF